MKPRQMGKQPPRYKFFLNPYSDVRFSKCPQCEGRTGQRKLPLVIYVAKRKELFVLNKTCRYCRSCDLLIAHRDEIAPFVEAGFGSGSAEDLLVVGTLDKADWQRDSITTVTLAERQHDFLEHLNFKMVGGWMPLK